MNRIRIFLSGSVKKGIDSLNTGKEYWETKQEARLKESLLPDVVFLNPNSLTLDKNDREGRFKADMKMLLSCDMVLVDGRKKKGIGIGAEMALAKNWKIPVYTILPLGSHYRQLDAFGVEWIHPFVYELSDVIFDSLDDFVSYINDSYSRGTLKKNKIDAERYFDKFNSFDWGYDEGYKATSVFWGQDPARLVVLCANRLKYEQPNKEVFCLDLGCGTGKNSIYLKKQGFHVDAIDGSFYAIEEARKNSLDISWKVRDIRKVYSNSKQYHAIIMTGSLHCLKSKTEVEKIVSTAQLMTCAGGYNVISAFNNTEQDLSGHPIDFRPILLTHNEYINMYRGWTIIESSNTVLEDIHKHNNIPHRHSITRILAKKNE